MRPVGVDANAAGVSVIVDVAAEMIAAINHEHRASRVGENSRDHRAGKSGPNDEAIGAQIHFSQVVASAIKMDGIAAGGNGDVYARK